MINLGDIRSICGGHIGISESLAKLTTFRVGGPVDIYVEPLNSTEVLELVKYFRKNSMPYIILGNGSNVLISDDGFRGAAISLSSGFSKAALRNGHVDAGAGMRLTAFVDFCIANGFAGTEMLAGIPGLLGGAVIMNASAYGGAISDHITDVTVLRKLAICTLPKEQCGFSYRHSDLQEDIVLSARFLLPAGETETLRAVRKDLIRKRNESQPTTLPNAGCIFKNPDGLHTARLIQECGLKGYCVGGAEVSTLHANFIVAHEGATAADVLGVINHVRRVVYDTKSIELELEVRLIGFADNAVEALMPNDDGGRPE